MNETQREFVPISAVQIDDAIEASVLDVLRSGHLVQGPKVAELEERFAAICGVEHAIAVNNGTTALLAAMAAVKLEPGDEIITSPFTFVATLNAALEAGAVVRFTDISLDDFCLDADQLDGVTTDRSRVVLPVHLYGQMADMDTITRHAGRHGLSIIEDAAQAHGATFNEGGAGSFGIGCFSFYATKNLTSGEGGMVTTDDGSVADHLRLLRNQGMRERYVYEVAGHNWRMTDLHASVALPQLDRLHDLTVLRQHNASVLTAELKDLEGLTTPAVLHGRTHVFHQYTIRVDEDGPLTRDELMAVLEERGIGHGIYYPKPVTDYDCYVDLATVVRSPTPNADRAAREVLSLPVHPYLDETDLERIVDAVRSAYGAS